MNCKAGYKLTAGQNLIKQCYKQRNANARFGGLVSSSSCAPGKLVLFHFGTLVFIKLFVICFLITRNQAISDSTKSNLSTQIQHEVECQ